MTGRSYIIFYTCEVQILTTRLYVMKSCVRVINKCSFIYYLRDPQHKDNLQMPLLEKSLFLLMQALATMIKDTTRKKNFMSYLYMNIYVIRIIFESVWINCTIVNCTIVHCTIVNCTSVNCTIVQMLRVAIVSNKVTGHQQL